MVKLYRDPNGDKIFSNSIPGKIATPGLVENMKVVELEERVTHLEDRISQVYMHTRSQGHCLEGISGRVQKNPPFSAHKWKQLLLTCSQKGAQVLYNGCGLVKKSGCGLPRNGVANQKDSMHTRIFSKCCVWARTCVWFRGDWKAQCRIPCKYS